MENIKMFYSSYLGYNHYLDVEFKKDSNETSKMSLGVAPDVMKTVDGDMEAEMVSLHPDKKEGDVCFLGKSIYDIDNIDNLSDLLFSAALIDRWYGCIHEEGEDFNETFVVAGELQQYGSREELVDFIEMNKGKISDVLSEDVDVLICNDANSPECKKAKELGITILTDLEFMGMYDSERYHDIIGNYYTKTVSVKEVAPITIGNFKADYKNKGITMDNLSSIIIRNKYEGYGSFAIWIDADNEVLADYKKQYEAADKDMKEKILNKMCEDLKNGIVLPINNNDNISLDSMLCIWSGEDEAIREDLEKYLDGKKEIDYWNTILSDEYHIDIATKEITSRKVLFVEQNTITKIPVEGGELWLADNVNNQ